MLSFELLSGLDLGIFKMFSLIVWFKPSARQLRTSAGCSLVGDAARNPFRNRVFIRAAVTMLAIIASTNSAAFAEGGKADFWLRYAESACYEVENKEAADRAFTRLLTVYVQWDNAAKAEKITLQIENCDCRARAYILIAKHYSEAGSLDDCKRVLNQATPLAVHSRDELVDAFLQFADAPKLAIAFIKEYHKSAEAHRELCTALAREGFVDEALEFAENEEDPKKQLSLKKRTAYAASKAGRIEATERIVQLLLADDSYKGDPQFIWADLAVAIYNKGDLETARKYAVRVTDKYTLRTTPDLRRIIDGVPRETPDAPRRRSQKDLTPLDKTVQATAPDEAERVVEAEIAIAEKDPIESTRGQFGPYDQRLRLANIRLGYFYVASLYRKAGKEDEANKAMKIAEESIRALGEDGNLLGSLMLPAVFFMQMRVDDIEGLRCSTAATHHRIWRPFSDSIVAKVLSSGDVESAKKIARRALGAQAASCINKRSDIISKFIEAGEMQVAHELIKTSEQVEITAPACESAGKTMIKTDHERLLRTSKWRNDIGAFQRAHLSIGAALMSKELMSK